MAPFTVTRNALIPAAPSDIMNMDKMVGGDFEKGLASLSAAATQKNS